jgi:hypothetical protein
LQPSKAAHSVFLSIQIFKRKHVSEHIEESTMGIDLFNEKRRVSSDMVERVEGSQSSEKIPGSVDSDGVAPEAIGTGNLPPGYFYSRQFLGTMVGVTLMNISLYVGYVLPVRIGKSVSDSTGHRELTIHLDKRLINYQ